MASHHAQRDSSSEDQSDQDFGTLSVHWWAYCKRSCGDMQLSEVDCREVFLKVRLSFENWLKVDQLLPYLKECDLLSDRDCYMLKCAESPPEKVHQLFEMLESKGCEALRLLFQALMESSEVLVGQIHHSFLAKHLKEAVEAVVDKQSRSGDEHSPPPSSIQPMATVTRDVTLTTSVASQVSTQPQPYTSDQALSLSSSLISTDQVRLEHPALHLVDTRSKLEPPALSSSPPPPFEVDPLSRLSPSSVMSSSNASVNDPPGSPPPTVASFPPSIASSASSPSQPSLDQLRPNSPVLMLHQTLPFARAPISSPASSPPPIQFTPTTSPPSVAPAPSSPQVKPLAPLIMAPVERPTFGKSASSPTLTSLTQKTFQPQLTRAEDEPVVPSPQPSITPLLLPPIASPFQSFQPTHPSSPASTSKSSDSFPFVASKEGSSLSSSTGAHMITSHFNLPFPSTQLWKSSDQPKKAVTAPVSLDPVSLREEDQSLSMPVTLSQQFTARVPAMSAGRGSEENSLSADAEDRSSGSGQSASVWAGNGESLHFHLMTPEPPRIPASSTPLKESQSVEVESLKHEKFEEFAVSMPVTLGVQSDTEGDTEECDVGETVVGNKTGTQFDSEQSIINAGRTESQPKLSDDECDVEQQEDSGSKHHEELGLSQRSALTDSDSELFINTAAEHGRWYTGGSTETEEEERELEGSMAMEDQESAGTPGHSDESRDHVTREVADTEICDPEIVAAISGEDPAEGLLILRRLIALGRNINCPTEAGEFPVHLAVTSPWQSKEKLLVLISGHVNLNATRKSDQKTALHLACLVHRLDLVESLVENGIDVNLQDSDGFTCMHFNKTLENSQVVDYLLHHDCEPDVPSKERYLTPVTIACMCGNSTVDSLTSLLQAGAAVDGHSLAPIKPLTVASNGGHLYIVRELLKYGADINIQDEDGGTALFRACSRSHYRVVEALLQAGHGNGGRIIDVNLPNKNGVTPLMVCISLGNGDLLNLLIHHSAEINCTSVCPLPNGNHFKTSPMCAACLYGHIDIVMILVDNRANVNYGGDVENSVLPIEFAARERKTDIVKFFLKLNDLDTSLIALKNSFVSLVKFEELQCAQMIVEKCGGFERMLADATEQNMQGIIEYIHQYRKMAIQSGLLLEPVSFTQEMDRESDEAVSQELPPKLKPSHSSLQADTQPLGQRRDQRKLIRVQRGKELRAEQERRLQKHGRSGDAEEGEEEELALSWSEKEKQSTREKERLLRSHGDRVKRKKKTPKEPSAEDRETTTSFQQVQIQSHSVKQITASTVQGRSQEEEGEGERGGMKELGSMWDKSQLSDEEEVRSKPQSLQDEQHHSLPPSAVASPLSSLGSQQQRSGVSSTDTPQRRTEGGGPLSPTGAGRAASMSDRVTQVNREQSPAPTSGATVSDSQPRPVTPRSPHPSSQPASLNRAILKSPLRPPQRLRDDLIDVLQEFIQISVAAITRTKSREWLLSQVEQSGYTHIVKFFFDFCHASATMSRDTKLVSAFLDGDPSPLNFMLSNHLVPKGDFEAVLRDFGKTEFKDQLMLALHELPGGEELPFTGEGIVDTLFSLEEPSYQTSSYPGVTSGRPQTAPQVFSTPQPHPPPQPQPQPHPHTQPQPRQHTQPQPRPHTQPQPQPRPHTQPQPQPHQHTQPQPRPHTQPQPHPHTQPQPRPHSQPQPHPSMQPHPLASPAQRAGFPSQAPSPTSSATPSSSIRPAGGHRLGYGNGQSHHSSSDLTHVNQLTSSGAHGLPASASSSTHVSASASPRGGRRLGWGDSRPSDGLQRQTSQQNQLDIEDSGTRNTTQAMSTEQDTSTRSTTQAMSTEPAGSSSSTHAASAMDDNLAEESPYQRKESSSSTPQTSLSRTSLTLGTINRLETNSSPTHQTSDETPEYLDELQKPVPHSTSMQPVDSKNTSQPTKSYEKATPTHDATPPHDATPTTATELATQEPLHSTVPLTTTPLPVLNTAPDSSSPSLHHGTETSMSVGLASDSKSSFTTGGAWFAEHSTDHVTQDSSANTLDNQSLSSQQEQTEAHGTVASAETVLVAVPESVAEGQDGTFSVEAILKNSQPLHSSSALSANTTGRENEGQMDTRDLESSTPLLPTPLPTSQSLQLQPSTVSPHPQSNAASSTAQAASTTQAARSELSSPSAKSFRSITGTGTRMGRLDSKQKHAGARPGQQVSQTKLRKQFPAHALSTSNTPRKSRIPILAGSSLKLDSHGLKPKSHVERKRESLRLSEDEKKHKIVEHSPLQIHPEHSYTHPSTKPYTSHNTAQKQKTRRRTQSRTVDDSTTEDEKRTVGKTSSKLMPLASSYSESGYSSVPTPKGRQRGTSTVRRKLTYIQGMCFVNLTVTEDAHHRIYETLSPHIRKWTIVGRYLEIDDETIKRIKQSSHRNEDCCSSMLQHWIANSPHATYTSLAEALENSMYTNLLPDLQKIMDKCTSSDIDLKFSLDQLDARSEEIRSLLLEHRQRGFRKAKINIKLFK